MTGKPPPLPRKPRSRPRNPAPDFGDEEPTRPQGIEFRVALLARYFRLCSSEDQAQLILEAERWAERNNKT